MVTRNRFILQALVAKFYGQFATLSGVIYVQKKLLSSCHERRMIHASINPQMSNLVINCIGSASFASMLKTVGPIATCARAVHVLHVLYTYYMCMMFSAQAQNFSCLTRATHEVSCSFCECMLAYCVKFRS
jgi:hypothetical protein